MKKFVKYLSTTNNLINTPNFLFLANLYMFIKTFCCSICSYNIGVYYLNILYIYISQIIVIKLYT